MTASGHENGERDRGTAIGHSDPVEAAAVTDSGNSRDRSRQSGFGGAASGQKTVTGHTETMRVNAMKPLAVCKPPTIAPRPHKAKQQTRRSTPTAYASYSQGKYSVGRKSRLWSIHTQ